MNKADTIITANILEQDLLQREKIRGALTVEANARVMMTIQLRCLIGRFENDAMKYITRFIDPRFLDEAIEERTVESKCGYLACFNDLRDSMGKLRDPNKQTIMPWQHSFCRPSCYQASRFYQEQLSAEPLRTREDVLLYAYGEMKYEQEILLLPEVKELALLNHKTIPEIIKEIIRNQHLESKLNGLLLDDIKEADHVKGGKCRTVDISERLH